MLMCRSLGSAAGVAILGTSAGRSDRSVRGSVSACFVVSMLLLYGTMPIHLLDLPGPRRQAEVALLLIDLDMSREGVGLQLLVQAARFLVVPGQRHPVTRSSVSRF
jgi:hypothetical protein